jgi:hypothetical protein
MCEALVFTIIRDLMTGDLSWDILRGCFTDLRMEGGAAGVVGATEARAALERGSIAMPSAMIPLIIELAIESRVEELTLTR